MEKEALLKEYRQVKYADISQRYIALEKWYDYLNGLDSALFSITEIGQSVLGNPIHQLNIGYGPNKVMMWSQMHGNETTTTKAVIDLLESIKHQGLGIPSLLASCTLCIIPVLNPDGAKAYTRVNANTIDLNRDAVKLSQPESKILRKVFRAFQPQYCFNLHDQRTIFSAGEQPKPASVSFLAPAFDEARNLNVTRLEAMQLIAHTNAHLQPLIPNRIGRYDDAFNENCVGDYFQREGAVTVLFEAGHCPQDYQREETRQYIYLALRDMLSAIAQQTHAQYTEEDYKAIPENQKRFYDIILRNVLYNGKLTNLAIQYREVLQDGKIQLVPTFADILSTESFFAHQFMEGKGQEVKLNEANENVFGEEIRKIRLNNANIFTDLTIS